MSADGAPCLLAIGCLNRPAPYFREANGRGIELFRWNGHCRTFEHLSTTVGIDNPTFLVLHPNGRWFYAVSEVHGWNEGLVSAYRIDPDGSRLTYLNKQPTLGSITAHASVCRNGRFLLAANYRMGDPADLPGQSIAVFPIRGDGSLSPATASVRLHGIGTVSERQEQPHAHCLVDSWNGELLFVADLGADRVLALPFDPQRGTVQADRGVECFLPPGSGPRHIALHPDGKHLLVSNELASTVAILHVEAGGACLRLG